MVAIQPSLDDQSTYSEILGLEYHTHLGHSEEEYHHTGNIILNHLTGNIIVGIPSRTHQGIGHCSQFIKILRICTNVKEKPHVEVANNFF